MSEVMAQQEKRFVPDVDRFLNHHLDELEDLRRILHKFHIAWNGDDSKSTSPEEPSLPQPVIQNIYAKMSETNNLTKDIRELAEVIRCQYLGDAVE